MVIPTVEQGLERLLRTALPLPADLGDVSFDAPDRTWGAQLSRLTVNLFLFEVGRSPQQAQPPADRPGENGRLQRRPAMPLVALTYLVSTWAGTTRDEHQLLGDVLGCFLRHAVLPVDHLPEDLPASVQLAVGAREGRRTSDIWSAIDGRLKPAFELTVTTAVDPGWATAAPPVERIESLTSPFARTPAPRADEPRPLVRRRAGAAVVVEGRPAAPEGGGTVIEGAVVEGRPAEGG